VCNIYQIVQSSSYKHSNSTSNIHAMAYQKQNTVSGTHGNGKRKHNDGNDKDKLKYVEIDNEAYKASFNLISSSSLLRSIITYFSNSCMSNEVSIFSKDGKEIPVSAALRDVVASYFIPVAMRAVRWILVTGLVPVSFENITHDLCIPVIPDPDMVTVSCARNVPGFRTIYRVTEKGSDNANMGSSTSAPVDKFFPGASVSGGGGGNASGKKSPGSALFVISDFSVPPPTSAGKLQSPFQTALSVIGDLNVLKIQRQQAMQCLVSPPIVTKVNDDRRDEADRGLSFEVIGGTNVLYNTQAAAVEHAKRYARDNPEALLGLRDDQRGDHGELTEFVNGALQKSMQDRATVMSLPTNHDLVKQHLPTLPPEYLATLKMHEEKICALFGLPLGVVMGYVGSHRTSSLKTGSAASNATEMHIAQIAVARMRLDLELFLTRVIKVACYKNHYENSHNHQDSNPENDENGNNAKRRKKSKDESQGSAKEEEGEQHSVDMEAKESALMIDYANAENSKKGDGNDNGPSAETTIKELGVYDLLPPGAYCKLRSMESVARSEEQSMINQELIAKNEKLKTVDKELERGAAAAGGGSRGSSGGKAKDKSKDGSEDGSRDKQNENGEEKSKSK